MNTPKFAYMLTNAMLFKLEIYINLSPSRLISFGMHLKKNQIFNERLQSLFISIDKWVMLKKTKGNRTLGQQQTTFFCSIVLSG